MNVLSNPEEYYKLQREVKDISNRQAFSNCYLTADVLAHYISQESVRYFLLQEGVAFLINRGTVYTFQFCLAPSSRIALPPMEKPLVADLVYRAGDISPAQQVAERQLIQAGFNLQRESHEYAIGTISESERKKEEALCRKLEKANYRFQPVEIERAGEAYWLLKEGIDPFNMHGFQSMNWEGLCANRQAFCVISPQNHICAVYVLPTGFRGGLSVVCEKYRGLGLGKAICFYSWYVAGHF
jgi:hypothetical protein